MIFGYENRIRATVVFKRTACWRNGRGTIVAGSACCPFALDKADFDLIIMDSQMAVMNGLEPTKRIRGRSDLKSRIRSCLSPRMPPKVQKRGSYQVAIIGVLTTPHIKCRSTFATQMQCCGHGLDVLPPAPLTQCTSALSEHFDGCNQAIDFERLCHIDVGARCTALEPAL